MQLVTILGEIIESGKVTVSTKNKEDIEITASNKRIDVNAKNKAFIKDVLSSLREGKDTNGLAKTIAQGAKSIKSIGEMRGVLDEIAEDLKKAGITITLSYEGDLVVTMGSKASSKFSRIFTGTKAIEINNLPKLIELGL
ncbi:MAG: hypothetical protein NWF04_10050 [Candidatus Bathyarchaeota archaeon]|nr:hypothetical protein [Candidatus Bathyarchaeota archaeon]